MEIVDLSRELDGLEKLLSLVKNATDFKTKEEARALNQTIACSLLRKSSQHPITGPKTDEKNIENISKARSIANHAMAYLNYPGHGPWLLTKAEELYAELRETYPKESLAA